MGCTIRIHRQNEQAFAAALKQFRRIALHPRQARLHSDPQQNGQQNRQQNQQQNGQKNGQQNRQQGRQKSCAAPCLTRMMTMPSANIAAMSALKLRYSWKYSIPEIVARMTQQI